MRHLINTAPKEPLPAATAGGNLSRDGAVAGNGNSGDASFDTNMVIILAALLCALICALGLNSVLRCALRCGRRLSPGGDATDEVPAVMATTTGLKKRALRRIPVEVYGPAAGTPATECPICLGEFANGEKVRVLPRCRHGFHVRCIDTWLAAHSSCPTCRNSLLDDGSAAAAPAPAPGR